MNDQKTDEICKAAIEGVIEDINGHHKSIFTSKQKENLNRMLEQSKFQVESVKVKSSLKIEVVQAQPRSSKQQSYNIGGDPFKGKETQLDFQKYMKDKNFSHEKDRIIQDLEPKFQRVIEKLQTDDQTMLKLEETFKTIKEFLNNSNFGKKYKNFKILMYGSTVNGLCLKDNSDLDLTIIINDFEIQHREILEALHLELEKLKRFRVQPVKDIKSGVLLQMKDQINNIDVDISLNKILEVYNSHLLYTYSLIDLRFLNMVTLIKHWNKKRFQNPQFRLNSYSIVLMVIGFLQSKQILPSLQELAKKQRKETLINHQKQFKIRENQQVLNNQYLTNIAFESDIEEIFKRFQPQNDNLTLSELIIEFFWFYRYKFNRLNESIDIQNGAFTSKDDTQNIVETTLRSNQVELRQYSEFLNSIINYSFMIVDPFDKTYNPAKSIKIDDSLENEYDEAFCFVINNLIRKTDISEFQ